MDQRGCRSRGEGARSADDAARQAAAQHRRCPRSASLRRRHEGARHQAAVNSSNSKPVTAEDWYGIYVVAGLAGPITGSGFDALAKKAGIKDLVDKYGAKGVTERAAKTGANSITSAALAAPFTIGVPVDVAKARTKAAIMKHLATRDLTPAQIEEYERYVDKSLGLAYGTPEKAAAKAYERHQKERPVPHPSGAAPGTVPRREGPPFPDGSELGEEVAN